MSKPVGEKRINCEGREELGCFRSTATFASEICSLQSLLLVVVKDANGDYFLTGGYDVPQQTVSDMSGSLKTYQTLAMVRGHI